MTRPRSVLGWSFLGWRVAASVLVMRRLARAANVAPPLVAGSVGDSHAGALPTISIVIPARNEARRLAPCLAGLQSARGVVEVLVVDDESSDSTADVARRHGARVISGAALPPGWAGKAWALDQGIRAASAEWVVTLDADTRPRRDLPLALVERMTLDEIDFATVAGRFDCPTTGSRWLHPAMLTTLVYRFGPPGERVSGERVSGERVSGERVSGVRPATRHSGDSSRAAGTPGAGKSPASDGSPGSCGWPGSGNARRIQSSRDLANGQCMAARRQMWVADGGMSAVGGALVEDVALARHLADRGRRVAMLDGSSLLTVRMFESLADTWTGWGRSVALPGVEPLPRQLRQVAELAVTQAGPLLRLAVRRGDPLDVMLIACRLGTLVGTRRAYTRRDGAYWLSPLADVPAVARLLVGVIRPANSWRGRTYPIVRRPTASM